ncbi:MAG: DPP IV N-terminal domain-containing protein, partial [Verrucomicrobiae bacterium]|nr:DPP IV N-terminal domain-containing protein [Verrucomicrobiae bacterium]
MRRLLSQSVLVIVVCLSCAWTNPTQYTPQRRPTFRQRDPRVFKDRIEPHWFGDNSCFWYRNDLPNSTKEFILVDAERGVRGPAFDHAKLAAALSSASGKVYHGNQLPFDSISFSGDKNTIQFTVDGAKWQCDLRTYQITQIDLTSQRADQPQRGSDSGGFRRRTGPRTARDDAPRSPDGRWTAFVRDHNVFIRSNDGTDKEIQLSHDGNANCGYGHLVWSPSSQWLVAFRIEPGDRKEVYLIESSPPEGGRAKLHSTPYALPGDKFPRYEVNVFEIATFKQIKPDVDKFEHEWLSPELHWNADHRRFAYQQVDRGHQRLRVIEIDAATGNVRNLVDERSSTFIWTAHTENLGVDPITWLGQTDELIHASECSGWRHLYLVDGTAGAVRNPITAGEWVVRGIDMIDETNRVVWFYAGGVYPDQDPYFVHYGRVDFDGSNLTFLTSGNGTHSVQYSPDRRYIIDTYSRVDQPPVHELRRTSDGAL